MKKLITILMLVTVSAFAGVQTGPVIGGAFSGTTQVFTNADNPVDYKSFRWILTTNSSGMGDFRIEQWSDDAQRWQTAFHIYDQGDGTLAGNLSGPFRADALTAAGITNFDALVFTNISPALSATFTLSQGGGGESVMTLGTARIVVPSIYSLDGGTAATGWFVPGGSDVWGITSPAPGQFLFSEIGSGNQWMTLSEVDGSYTMSTDAALTIHSYAISNTITANYTASQDDYILPVDASGGAKTITLPTLTDGGGVRFAGKPYVIKKTDSSTNAVTVVGAGSETFDGAASISTTSKTNTLKVAREAGSANWIVIY
jgi:hypothetical protein